MSTFIKSAPHLSKSSLEDKHFSIKAGSSIIDAIKEVHSNESPRFPFFGSIIAHPSTLQQGILPASYLAFRASHPPPQPSVTKSDSHTIPPSRGYTDTSGSCLLRIVPSSIYKCLIPFPKEEHEALKAHEGNADLRFIESILQSILALDASGESFKKCLSILQILASEPCARVQLEGSDLESVRTTVLLLLASLGGIASAAATHVVSSNSTIFGAFSSGFAANAADMGVSPPDTLLALKALFSSADRDTGFLHTNVDVRSTHKKLELARRETHERQLAEQANSAASKRQEDLINAALSSRSHSFRTNLNHNSNNSANKTKSPNNNFRSNNKSSHPAQTALQGKGILPLPITH